LLFSAQIKTFVKAKTAQIKTFTQVKTYTNQDFLFEVFYGKSIIQIRSHCTVQEARSKKPVEHAIKE
jgi:hypothetical protein